MTRIALAILALIFIGCTGAPVCHFRPGAVLVLQFVEDAATVEKVAREISSEDPGRKITAHLCEDTGTLVVSAQDFTPEALAEALTRFARGSPED